MVGALKDLRDNPERLTCVRRSRSSFMADWTSGGALKGCLDAVNCCAQRTCLQISMTGESEANMVLKRSALIENVRRWVRDRVGYKSWPYRLGSEVLNQVLIFSSVGPR